MAIDRRLYAAGQPCHQVRVGRSAAVARVALGDAGAAERGLPRRHGFGYFFGYLNQTHAHNHFPAFLWRNEERIALPNKVTPVGPVPGAGYATEAVVFADDLFADEALKFVANHQQRPFFLYWSMVIPHANNERSRELKNGAHVPDFGPYAGKDWPEPDKGQAAMITRMDRDVGRIVGLLETDLPTILIPNRSVVEILEDVLRSGGARSRKEIRARRCDGHGSRTEERPRHGM